MSRRRPRLAIYDVDRLWFSYLYCLSWALHFTRSAKDALWFVYRVRFFLRCRMALRLNPVEHADWTYRYADAVSIADILIQGHLGSMDTQFFRGFGFTSDFVTIVFACYRFFHEVWIYWHVELHPLLQIDTELSYLCFAQEGSKSNLKCRHSSRTVWLFSWSLVLLIYLRLISE